MRDVKTGKITDERTDRGANTIINILVDVLRKRYELRLEKGERLADALFRYVKDELGKSFNSVFGEDKQFSNFFRELHAVFKTAPTPEARELVGRIYRTAHLLDREEYKDRRDSTEWIH